MKKTRNPSRAEKKLMDKLRLQVSDWLVREHTKNSLKLVHRWTKQKIERSLF